MISNLIVQWRMSVKSNGCFVELKSLLLIINPLYHLFGVIKFKILMIDLIDLIHSTSNFCCCRCCSKVVVVVIII